MATFGIQPTKGLVDSGVGSVALRTRDLMAEWQYIYNWLSAQTDSQLTALGYDAAGVTACRLIQNDAFTLLQVVNGQGTVLSTYNFLNDMAKWWGNGFS